MKADLVEKELRRADLYLVLVVETPSEYEQLSDAVRSPKPNGPVPFSFQETDLPAPAPIMQAAPRAEAPSSRPLDSLYPKGAGDIDDLLSHQQGSYHEIIGSVDAQNSAYTDEWRKTRQEIRDNAQGGPVAAEDLPSAHQELLQMLAHTSYDEGLALNLGENQTIALGQLIAAHVRFKAKERLNTHRRSNPQVKADASWDEVEREGGPNQQEQAIKTLTTLIGKFQQYTYSIRAKRQEKTKVLTKSRGMVR